MYAEFGDPQVGEGRAEVALVAAGIHQVVRSRVAGRHYSVEGSWPAVPGVDAVARTPDGRLVYTGFVDPRGDDGRADGRAGAVRDGAAGGVDPLAVAAGMNPGAASWLPLSKRADELAGTGLDRVLVLGATGMSGGIAVENAYALGATTVVAAGRNEDKLATLVDRVGAGRVGGARDLRTVALTGESKPTPQRSSRLWAVVRRASRSTSCGARWPKRPSSRSAIRTWMSTATT